MAAPAFIDYLAGTLGVLLVFAVACFGVGLLLERLFRVELPRELVIPIGFCGSVVLSLAAFELNLGVAPAVIAVLTATAAGLVLTGRSILGRLPPLWLAAGALATYVLFNAPVIFTGHWTWSGYNFVNDTATQWLLAGYLKAHGTHAIGLLPPRSTASEFIRVYLATSYPLGSQAELATLSGILHVGPEVIYQGYLSAMAAVTTLALGSLIRRAVGDISAAVIGFLAAGAELTYQYALQGNVKEMAALACTLIAIALIQPLVAGASRPRSALLLSVPVAALLEVYYAAALPYAGAASLLALITFLWRWRRAPGTSRREIVFSLIGALVIALVLSIPALGSLVNSFSSLSGSFATSGSGPQAPVLGQLLRPLPLSEVSGVFLRGDYRYPINPGIAATLTVIATVAIFVAAPIGVLLALRERQIGPLLLLVLNVLVIAVVVPRVSPYAGGKVLAIASPTALLCAMSGCVLVFRQRKVLMEWRFGLLATALAAGFSAALPLGVLASDATAYHSDYVAPTTRMLAIEQVGQRFHGKGLILWNEFEEYAKYLGEGSQINVPFEALTKQQAVLVHPQSIYAAYFDLDDETLPFVEGYPYLALRRSPAASRPPANYGLVYSNAYYEVWRRRPNPTVLRHLPIQNTYAYTVAGRPACTDVAALVHGAPGGSRLVAAIHPGVSLVTPQSVTHSATWPTDGGHAEALTLVGAGTLDAGVPVAQPGANQLWVQGSFSRPMTVYLSGRKVRTLQGVNTPQQWYSVGTFTLPAGKANIAIVRPGGGLGPGNGGPSYIGPIVLATPGHDRLIDVALPRWRSLCAGTYDWIELVRG